MIKKPLMALTLCLGFAAQPSVALDLSAMSPEERTAFGEQVRAYLMENPQVIMEAVNALEQQQANAQAQVRSKS